MKIVIELDSKELAAAVQTQVGEQIAALAQGCILDRVSEIIDKKCDRADVAHIIASQVEARMSVQIETVLRAELERLLGPSDFRRKENIRSLLLDQLRVLTVAALSSSR